MESNRILVAKSNDASHPGLELDKIVAPHKIVIASPTHMATRECQRINQCDRLAIVKLTSSLENCME